MDEKMILTIVVTVLAVVALRLAVAVLPFIKAPLPPQVQQLLPWRWAILAGLNALLLLFLGLQMVLSFGLESSVSNWAYSVKENQIKETDESKVVKQMQAEGLIGVKGAPDQYVV